MSKDSLPPRTKFLFIILIIVCGVFVYNFEEVYHKDTKENYAVKEVTQKDFGEDVFFMDITKDSIAELTNSEDSFVRQQCAQSNIADEKTLLKLAQDKDIYVRRSVAINKSATIEILRLLAQDKDNYTKRLVLNHPNITLEDVYKIAEDSSIPVRWHIARSDTFDETIWDIWKSQKLPLSVIMEIANNENTPTNILAELIHHEENQVRRSIAENKQTTVETLQKLLEDKDEQTIFLAQQNLNQKN